MFNCFEYVEQRVNLFRVRFPNPWFLTNTTIMSPLYLHNGAVKTACTVYKISNQSVKRNFGLLGLEFPDVFETD